MCLGTKWRGGHKWHNMVVKQGRRMTGVGYTDWHCTPCFRYPCGYLPTPPSPPAWKRCIYISIRSSFDPPRTRATTLPASLRTLIAPPSSAAFPSTRRRCLADLLFAWMIKFIRSSRDWKKRTTILYFTMYDESRSGNLSER